MQYQLPCFFNNKWWDSLLFLPRVLKHNVIELDKISQNSIQYYFHYQAQVVSLGLSFSICKMATPNQIVERTEYKHENHVAHTGHIVDAS